VLRGESEVMDSLIQFATQQLIATPGAKYSLPPMEIPEMKHLPSAKIQDMHELINDIDSPTERARRAAKLDILANRKTPTVPLNVAAPYYISGAVIGSIVAIALMSILKR
jgi:hypothetical protein